MRVVEFGYAGAGGEERLHQLMQDEKAVLVDIRLSPRSRWQPQFNRSALASTYPGAYLWLGDTLGNLNYKPEDREKGIKLVKPETGIARLITGMRKGFIPIIMCACKEFTTCHRHTVIDLLHAQVPELEVVHAEDSKQLV